MSSTEYQKADNRRGLTILHLGDGDDNLAKDSYVPTGEATGDARDMPKPVRSSKPCLIVRTSLCTSKTSSVREVQLLMILEVRGSFGI